MLFRSLLAAPTASLTREAVLTALHQALDSSHGQRNFDATVRPTNLFDLLTEHGPGLLVRHGAGPDERFTFLHDAFVDLAWAQAHHAPQPPEPSLLHLIEDPRYDYPLLHLAMLHADPTWLIDALLLSPDQPRRMERALELLALHPYPQPALATRVLDAYWHRATTTGGFEVRWPEWRYAQPLYLATLDALRQTTGLTANSSPSERSHALERNPTGVQALATTLGRYGIAICNVGHAEPAAAVRREQIILTRLLLNLPDGATEEQQRIAATEQPKLTRDLAIALFHRGGALLSLDRSGTGQHWRESLALYEELLAVAPWLQPERDLVAGHLRRLDAE